MEVAYGNTRLEYLLTRSNKRSLAIEVHPDQSIQVIAPQESSIQDIEEKVVKRGRWIVKQQMYFEQFLPRTPEREYVSGETHYYLGRKYILRIRKAKINSVKLKGGQLRVESSNSSKESIRKLLTIWYYKHANRLFEQRLDIQFEKFRKFKLNRPTLKIERMKKRWGSCTVQNKVILNPEIIKTPTRCIDYVIIHELCHLIEHNHSSKFYGLQAKMMPDWEKWKLRLEQTLV